MNKWKFQCLSSKQECAGTYVACHNFVHHIYLDYLMQVANINGLTGLLLVFDTSFERSRICEDIHLLAVITSMFHSSLQYEINNISFLLKYRIYVTVLRLPKQIKKSWRKPKRCQVTPKNIYNKSVDFSCSLALHHLFYAKNFLHNTKSKTKLSL